MCCSNSYGNTMSFSNAGHVKELGRDNSLSVGSIPLNLITNEESTGDVAIVHALVKENLLNNIVSRGPEEVLEKPHNKSETT